MLYNSSKSTPASCFTFISTSQVNSIVTVMESEKILHEAPCIKWNCDSFNGIVAIFEDPNVMSEKRFWVEQQRKDVYTDFLTLDEANAQFNAFMSDTMF